MAILEPGTGKTIVALHRVRHLVDRLAPGHNKPVLFTTFSKNLAADLRSRLLSPGGPQTLDRVDIVHVDQLATRVRGRPRERQAQDRRRTGPARVASAPCGGGPEPLGRRVLLCDEWNQVWHCVAQFEVRWGAGRVARGRARARPRARGDGGGRRRERGSDPLQRFG
ncbi:UvrD-helicase domain-containing protein [Streptomyces sp. LNU-CPARS28]|uniref:UvrD-helicase domain-containing protein n=1 Tax=Streptomyces sp. LNU-CPARS28 TaxID=3137371 RepID=UPI003135D4F9